MKFYYTVKPEHEDKIILKLPCPYVLEDFAISLMQQFVGGQTIVQNLPEGAYIVNLVIDNRNSDEECSLTTTSFEKNTNGVFFR